MRRGQNKLKKKKKEGNVNTLYLEKREILGLYLINSIEGKLDSNIP